MPFQLYDFTRKRYYSRVALIGSDIYTIKWRFFKREATKFDTWTEANSELREYVALHPDDTEYRILEVKAYVRKDRVRATC